MEEDKRFPMTIELVGPGGRLSTATVGDALSLADELDYLSTLIKPGDTMVYRISKGRVTVAKAEPLDKTYLRSLESTLSEWSSEEDAAGAGLREAVRPDEHAAEPLNGLGEQCV